MFGLVQTALDFDVIENELEQQIDLLGQELFVSYVNEALFELEEQHNITTPLAETVSEITERVYWELEVLQTIDDSVNRAELETALDLSAAEIEKALHSLEEKDVITVEDHRITKEATTL